jgi:hypothetical protein
LTTYDIFPSLKCDTLPNLHVPQLHLLVVLAGQGLVAVIGKDDVLGGYSVPVKVVEVVTVGVDVPGLDTRSMLVIT